MVADDVVELAGDPQPFVDDCPALESLGLSGDGRRLLLEPGALAGSAPGDLPHEDGPDEVEGVDRHGRDDGSDSGAEPPVGAVGAGVLGDLRDPPTEGELPSHPQQHEDGDARDDEEGRAPVPLMGDGRIDGDEVHGLQGQLTHDHRHGDTDDEHVRSRQTPHEDRVLAPPDHEHGAGDDRGPLDPQSVATRRDLGDAAGHLEQEDAGDREADADQPVAPADR